MVHESEDEGTQDTSGGHLLACYLSAWSSGVSQRQQLSCFFADAMHLEGHLLNMIASNSSFQNLQIHIYAGYPMSTYASSIDSRVVLRINDTFSSAMSTRVCHRNKTSWTLKST